MRQTEQTFGTRTIPEWNPRVKLTLRAKGGLNYLRGNSKPYFSLTKEEHRKGHPNQCQSFGCDHETILKYFPSLADLAALHLSDIDGVPMHAEANGWYSIAGSLPDQAGERYTARTSQQHFPKPVIDPAKPWDTTDYRNPTEAECLVRFAEHARVSVETAAKLRMDLIECWKQTRNNDYPPEAEIVYGAESWKQARAMFAAWIEEQKPRWKAEAEACIAKHGLVVYGDQWPQETDAA